MKSIRTILEFVNESGLIITAAIMIGYFGIRGVLGWLPVFASVIGIIGLLALAYLFATAQTSGDDYGYSESQSHWVDKFIFYSLLFLGGFAAFGTIGILI